MATIEKRTADNGTLSYRVKVRIKGHPAATATFPRLTDAKKWASKTEAAIREGRYFKTAEAQKQTVADLVDRYTRDVLPGKSRASIEKQGQQLAWWRQELGAYTLADCTPARIGEARDKLFREPMASRKPHPDPNDPPRYREPATVTRYLAALSHAFTIAVKEWGWAEDNPVGKVRKPQEPRGRVRFLSDDERTRLLEACKASTCPVLYPVVVLALSTGMRAQEIMRLTWDRVDLKAGRILLEETKNGERRAIPLVGSASELLKEHGRVRRLDTDLLWPGHRHPDKPIELRGPWLEALQAAGIEDFRFHDLRHTAASYLLMNGASIGELAEVLGHKTLQMVKRYSHLSESHARGLLERMNTAMFGV